MLIRDINISSFNSALINSLLNIDPNTLKNIKIPDFLNENELKEFNSKHITPNNINKIIMLLKYFIIKDEEINEFIIKYSVPSTEPFEINKYNYSTCKNLKIPSFMKMKFNFEKNQINEICILGLSRWLKYILDNAGNIFDEYQLYLLSINNHYKPLNYIIYDLQKSNSTGIFKSSILK